MQLLRFAGAQVAYDARICSSVKVFGTGELSIGANTWVGHEVLLIVSSTVAIGDNVDIGPRVYIGTGTHLVDSEGPRTAGPGVSKPITVQNGAWIGACATILPGVTIGTKALVGAGSLVRTDISSDMVVAGVPARTIRSIASPGINQ